MSSSRISQDYRRVLEDRVDSILERRLLAGDSLARWLVGRAFGPESELIAVERVCLHEHSNHTKESGDPLAWGETDVQLVARCNLPALTGARLALFIENKVDAKQMEKQGLRCRARGAHGVKTGSWSHVRSVLLAPGAYLEAAYALGDHSAHGWDLTVSYEELAHALAGDPTAAEDVETLLEATRPANAWNKPDPAAVQFWKDYEAFALTHYPGISVFVETQRGSRAGGVWPSFYDDKLRRLKGDPWLRRVQIVHIDTRGSHVSLFVKKVKYGDFASAVAEHLGPGMRLAEPGGSWQSVQIGVPPIDPRKPLEVQTESVHAVFDAVSRLHEFFTRHEAALKAIPVMPSVARKRKSSNK